MRWARPELVEEMTAGAVAVDIRASVEARDSVDLDLPHDEWNVFDAIDSSFDEVLR